MTSVSTAFCLKPFRYRLLLTNWLTPRPSARGKLPEGEVESVVVTLQDMTPLEDLERLRAEFLGMVSHELRTPLAAIKGSVDTLLEASSELDAATGKCHPGGEVLWRLRPHVVLAPDEPVSLPHLQR